MDGMGACICGLGLSSSACKRSHDVGWLGDVGTLCLGLHTAEDDQLDKYASRYYPRSLACLDGLGGGRSKLDGSLRVDSVRSFDRVAVAALHGDSLDVPRAIRIGGLQDDLGNGSLGPRSFMARDSRFDRTHRPSRYGDSANDDRYCNFVCLERCLGRLAVVCSDSICKNIGPSYRAKDAARQPLPFASDFDADLNLSMGSLS